MKVLQKTTADDDLLNNAQFDPVFDADGNLVDIVHLKVTTDRTRGIKAMLEMANSEEAGDSIVHQDGWTGKQKRILNSPAPGAAHTIKRSKRWDAALGQFMPTATLILPFEVVWVLFEEVFANNYSVEIKEILHESEDIVSSGADGARDLPGRIFYARATVTLTVHLANGTTRKFEGVGVAYDSVRMEMSGNIFAVNSARRTAEKGAVSDAKREALSNMGRVFRRAFEDGAEALRVIEEKLMEKMRGANKPGAARKNEKPVPAPKVVREEPESEIDYGDDIPGDYLPAEAYDELHGSQSAQVKNETEKKPSEKLETKKPKEKVSAPKAKPKTEEVQDKKQPEKDQVKEKTNRYGLLIGETTESFETPQATFDAAIAHLDTLEEADAKVFLKTNEAALLKAEADDEIGEISYQDLMEMVEESLDSQETEEEAIDPGYALSPDKMTGDSILKAYEKAFKAAKDKDEINKILDANTELAKRLTKRQKGKLTAMVIAAQ